jgi:hypothetical protein
MKAKKKDPAQVRQAQLAAGVRPLWVLLPGGRPRMVNATAHPCLGEASHYCREGDRHWKPIAELRDEP